MKSPAAAKVLVAGDDAREARQLVEILKNHFENVECSTDGDAAATEFEKHAPEIIVLAFKSLEQAERYYLGLHRFSQAIYQHPHRTVLLCRKEDTASAFELCKKRYFDEYVLYWPNPPEGWRLPMSVWQAGRDLLAQHKEGPTVPQLRSHANQLADLDRRLTQELEAGERRAGAARESLLDLERDLSTAHDELSNHLVRGGGGAIEVKDSDALARELAQFKSRQIERARAAGDQGITPISAWAQELKASVEPALSGTRELTTQLQQLRPVLLVVDDDEAMRTILKPVLSAMGYDVLLASSGNEALQALSRTHPDVILMDIRLTDSDGVTLTRKMKSLPKLADIPVILMTGDSRRERLMSSIEAGAADFLAKPFTSQVLKAKLEKVLR
jgi:CheY-like chemotaxis protein